MLYVAKKKTRKIKKSSWEVELAFGLMDLFKKHRYKRSKSKSRKKRKNDSFSELN